MRNIQTAKEKVKLSLLSYDKIYIDNPKESVKEILEVIREFSKVLGYKINIALNLFPGFISVIQS